MTRYEVHTGTPSWHQQRAGHISSGVMVWSTRAEAETYMRRCLELRPNERAFIIEREGE